MSKKENKREVVKIDEELLRNMIAGEDVGDASVVISNEEKADNPKPDKKGKEDKLEHFLNTFIRPDCKLTTKNRQAVYIKEDMYKELQIDLTNIGGVEMKVNRLVHNILVHFINEYKGTMEEIIKANIKKRYK